MLRWHRVLEGAVGFRPLNYTAGSREALGVKKKKKRAKKKRIIMCRKTTGLVELR